MQHMVSVNVYSFIKHIILYPGNNKEFCINVLIQKKNSYQELYSGSNIVETNFPHLILQ